MVTFMRSPAGRAIRFVVGIFLVWWGFWGGAGWVVGVIGFVPIIAGIFNLCFLAPFFGYSMTGVPRSRSRESRPS